MQAAAVRAQAKVNLGLRVLAREASGYHQLETIFCRLDLADEVRVELTTGSRSLACSGPTCPEEGLGPGEANLAWRAAAAYLTAAGSTRGFHIDVVKHIPVGGGLGGGSADAGAVLRLMEGLVGGVGTAGVLELARRLGADVPFLTQEDGLLALGYSRGERLVVLPTLPVTPVVLVLAPFGISTAEAFSWLATESSTAGVAVKGLGALGSWEGILRDARNDFEPAVMVRRPSLAAAHRALADSLGPGSSVLMSGSGATLFGMAPASGLPAEVRGLPVGFRAVRTTTASALAPCVPG